MLISVIIPVYNVEKYLSQCLDSVINQTYKNLEIICVDDSSTDNSLEILKEYAQKDTRIKIIKNEKNLGLGLTRNEGVKVAKGEYIHFLDSDDWMNLNAYEKLFDTVKKINFPDVITFSYFSHNQITGKIKKIRLLTWKHNNYCLATRFAPKCCACVSVNRRIIISNFKKYRFSTWEKRHSTWEKRHLTWEKRHLTWKQDAEKHLYLLAKLLFSNVLKK